MKPSSVTKAAAMLAAVACLAIASTSHATIGDEAKCRDTIVKNAAKLQATVGKAQRKCVKDTLKGKQTLAKGDKCHQTTVADTKGKVGKTDGKLQDQVGEGDKTKCDLAVDTITLTGHGPKCAVGVNDAELLVTTFDDVSDCAASAAIGSAELVFGEIINPAYTAINALPDDKLIKNVGKCADAIAKNGIKAVATIAKERRKVMKKAEKKGSLSSNATASYPEYNLPNDKITKAIDKLKDQIDKRCVDPDKAPLGPDVLRLLGSCDSTVAGIKSCVEEAVRDTGEGFIGLMYVNPNKSPVAADVLVNSGSTASGSGTTPIGQAPNGRRNRTELDAGFTGLGHNADVVDGFEGKVELDCDSGGICNVTASCDKGNCRCANDVTAQCDEPFGPDADDCAGNDCNLFFGPPLALSASSTPTCVVNVIDSLAGTVDLSNGNSLTNVQNRSVVYLGIVQSQPCPTCAGDSTANDGNADGLCDGGARNGLSCDENANHPTFGPSSYDCQPSTANVSGVGLQINLDISDEPDDLAAQKSCGGALPTFDCHCRVCTGGGNLPCNDDLDCPGAETCTTNGAGVAQVQPNGCNDLDDAFVCGLAEDGKCENTTTGFCDGMVRASGFGILNCASDGDCDANDPECPGGDCGLCSLTENIPCFDQVINASEFTNSGADHAVLGTNFCIPPTSSGAVNSAAGSPGPGRVLIDFNFDIFCPDGVTEAVYGGTNCP